MSLAESLNASEFAIASESDLRAVRNDMALEQEWLASQHRYATNEEVLEAYEDGELVWVSPSDSYRPIRTLTEPNNFSRHQPYLRPGAKIVLDHLGNRAQELLRDYGVKQEIRLPITSMIRSEERQTELAHEPGKLALSASESGHPTGWDFDVDSSSYYLWQEDEWVSVSRRNTQIQEQIAEAREHSLGEIPMPTRFVGSEYYDSRIRLAVHFAIAEFFGRNILAPVVEYANTPNELIHVGVNPSGHPAA